MNIIALTTQNAPDLANALTAFETAFSYPLGAHLRFRIDHGDDYLRFFRAMGDAQCFVAMDNHRVIGTVSVTVRRLIQPDGQSRSAAYIGDLKIAADARGGWALIKLARAAAAWALKHTHIAYSVVMDGTSVTPDAYTGRAGLLPFDVLAEIAVIRLPVESPTAIAPTMDAAPFESVVECFHSLSADRYAVPAFDPTLRSDMAPVPIALPNGDACGFIEDTRRAKRLMLEDGTEMLSAHLSHFAYRTTADGARLINVARSQAASLGFPALFFAVYRPDARLFLNALAASDATVATATVYGCGLPNNAAWNINTSEI
jgi:hypothetical protein